MNHNLLMNFKNILLLFLASMICCGCGAKRNINSEKVVVQSQAEDELPVDIIDYPPNYKDLPSKSDDITIV